MNLKKIINYGFNILIKGVGDKNKKIKRDYIKRLKNAGEIFENYNLSQIKTLNGKRKRVEE